MIFPSRNSRNTAKRPSSALQPEWIQRARPKFRPTPLPAPPGRCQLSLALSYTSAGTWPRSAPSRAAARSRFLPRGVRKVGEFLQDYIGGKELFWRGSRFVPFEALQASPQSPDYPPLPPFPPPQPMLLPPLFHFSPP